MGVAAWMAEAVILISSISRITKAEAECGQSEDRGTPIGPAGEERPPTSPAGDGLDRRSRPTLLSTPTLRPPS